MTIAIWKTGHEIADRVAEAIEHGNTPELYRIHGTIGYGILRGTAEAFRAAEARGEPYFNLDRGYFLPSHFDGYYRVSLNGTQQTGFWPMPSFDRWKALGITMAPWRGFDHSKPVLVVPPTEAVAKFFDIEWPYIASSNFVVRKKGSSEPINFHDYNYVLTFNSSLGWQGLVAGIPCASHPTYSMVGSWYNDISLENLAEAQYIDRERLFATMCSLQFTLKEISDGMLWPLMENLIQDQKSISSLDSIHGKQSLPMSAPIA